MLPLLLLSEVTWFDWVTLIMFGLIVLFEFVDWSFDKDIELLKEQNRILTTLHKTIEKIEHRLEQLYIEQIKK